MANQRRLADNVNRYEAGHTGAPRRGAALLQGIAVCGRCGRRMCLEEGRQLERQWTLRRERACYAGTTAV
jgi:hypothetical protein